MCVCVCVSNVRMWNVRPPACDERPAARRKRIIAQRPRASDKDKAKSGKNGKKGIKKPGKEARGFLVLVAAAVWVWVMVWV